MNNVRPMLQALMLADHIYVDAATGKKVIAGTFNRMAADEFPTTFDASKFAFVAITGVHGVVQVTLRYVDLSTGDALAEIPNLEVESHDPLETVEMVVELPKLPMPHPGAYAFEAHWEGEMLGLLRIFVESREANAEQEPSA
jgi:hypothetical protein